MAYTEILARFKGVFCADTAEQLAHALELPLEEVENALEEGVIPATWYVAAYWVMGVSPKWLEYGEKPVISRDMRQPVFPAEVRRAWRFLELTRPLPSEMQETLLKIAQEMRQTYLKTINPQQTSHALSQ